MGDNILAILTELRSSREAVQRILNAIAKLEPGEREAALKVLILFAGLRELEETVEREASQMAVFEDILDNKVLGREYKRGLQDGMEKGLEKGLEQGRRREVAMLRRLIAKRFGRIPRSFDARLNKLSAAELEALGERIIDARTLEELLP